MLFRIRQFLTLTGLTALEAIRQPVFLLLTLSCVVLTGIVPLALLHQFGEEGKLERDSALALHFVFGLFVAGNAACLSLSRELRSGTASTVLSKPVGRGMFFVSKFAGVAAVVAGFSFCCMLATLLAERVAEKFVYTSGLQGYITDTTTGWLLLAAPAAACLGAGLINYAKRRPFGSVAFGLLVLALLAVMFFAGFHDRRGGVAPFDCQLDWRLLPAGILITMALITISAVALTVSIRFGVVPTMSVSGAVLLVGLMSDAMFGRYAGQSVIAAVIYRLVPNWQYFWLPDALTAGGTIPWSYVLNAGIYAAAWSAGVICAGTLIFRSTEMR